MQSKQRKIQYLSLREWEHLENITKSERDSLILKVLYETGCTVNELVNIKIMHCDFIGATIKIRSEHARNHETRTAYISEKLSRRLKSYAEKATSEYLFSTRQSAMMTTKRVHQLVEYYCSLCGIMHAGPQLIRYTHIVHAYQKGIPLDAIRAQVGLRRSRAIEIFQQLPLTDTRDAYRKFVE